MTQKLLYIFTSHVTAFENTPDKDVSAHCKQSSSPKDPPLFLELLTFSQTTDFELFLFETVCRRRF